MEQKYRFVCNKTSYQYLTEIRRFFDWLRSQNLSSAKDNQHVAVGEKEVYLPIIKIIVLMITVIKNLATKPNYCCIKA